jgi:uncharacterized protein
MDRILLTGGSGLLGTAFRRSLGENGEKIVQLVRQSNLSPVAGSNEPREARVLWDPYAPKPLVDSSLPNAISAAVHLSGVNLTGHRWTRAFKQSIRESRVRTTEALVSVLVGLERKPEVFVSASGIGVYGDNRGDELLDEESAPGSDFLASVCRDWENAARPLIDAGIRVVHLRFGVVLSPEGGALRKMLPIFRLGMGGRLGSGRHWMSWVALPDAVRAIGFALRTKTFQGPANVVAPQAVRNTEFTRILGATLDRPALLNVPEAVLKLVFGEMAEAMVLASQRVLSKNLQHAGFEFQHPELPGALRSVLGIESNAG